MKVTNEQRAEGGRTQSQKIYHCPTCDGLGRNQGFITNHLAKQCDGKQKRKVKKCTAENQHRLEEAKLNTREWQAKQIKKESKKLLKQLQADAIRDIESLHQINEEVMEDIARAWLTKIF